MKPEHKAILKKYFSGECSEEEKRIIEQLLLNDDNVSFSEYLQSEWDSLPEHTITDEATAAHRYDKVLKVIGKGRRRWSMSPWYWAAAVLLIVLTPLFYMVFMKPGGGDLKWLTVSTGVGEQRELILPDGSKVWLNCESAITYPETFAGHDRKISMKGEAFFAVAKNPAKPFIVAFDKYYTKVLGTSFNIKSYGEDAQHYVTVIEGKVAVGKINGEKLQQYTTLSPDESVTFSTGSGNYEKSAIPGTANIVAWKKGEIRFLETPLPTVITELERWYNADLVLEQKTGDKAPSFTIIINPQTSLDDVLKILSMTNKISYRKINDKILITPN